MAATAAGAAATAAGLAAAAAGVVATEAASSAQVDVGEMSDDRLSALLAVATAEAKRRKKATSKK